MKRELLKDAYQILAGIPKNRYAPDLSAVVRRVITFDDGGPLYEEPYSGMLACGAGWLALAKFEGLEYSRQCYGAIVLFRGTHFSYDVATALLFGISNLKADNIFCTRRSSQFDSEPGANRLSDKALLLYRIRRTLGEARTKSLKMAREDQ